MQFSSPRSIGSPLCLAALSMVALLAGCPGSTENNTTDGGIDCDASKQSGLYLLRFGPIVQDMLQGGKASLTVVVVRGAPTEGEGRPEQGQTVSFRVVNAASGEVTLAQSDAQTDVDGLAGVSASIAQSAPPMIYQIEASAAGTCPITFSLDVTRPLRQLRAVTPSPFDTFTNSRIPIAVEASTNGNAKLIDEEITFEIAAGKTGETLLSTVDGKTPGATLKIKTDGTGRATAMLSTGSQAISTLEIKATMAGTAPAIVKVRVQVGNNKKCQDDSDCPLGYNCNTALSACEPPPPPPPSTGCKADKDCQPPTICNVSTGQCLEPTGKGCDPIEGTGCDPNEVCVGSQCAKLPAGCKDNSECPPTWVCQAGSCKPAGQPPSGGCKTPQDCPANQTCVNGSCKPKAACNIPHAKDRLKGTWQFDSTLHLRQGLDGFTKAILSVAGALSGVINGTFGIKGIPSFISSIVKKYLKKLIDQYVPPWGQQLIVTLGNVNDIVDDMRILSTVQMNAVGNDNYVCSEQWNLIEFEYQGKKISSPPSAIPEIGNVKVPNYTATEVCGVLFLSKHKIKNVIGGLIKWAIQTVLSLVTCNNSNTPCFNSIEQALQQTINCAMLALQLDQMVQSFWSGAPSIAGIIQPACDTAKNDVIQKLNKSLDDLTTKLTFFELSGTADIPNPGQDSQLKNGVWSGWLGYSLSKGNFKGDFKAVR